MAKIDLKKGSSLGFMLWAFLFIAASAIISYDLFSSVEAAMYSTTFFIILSGAASFFFSRKLDISDRYTGLMYGALWVAIGVVLDRLITNPFNHNLFSGVSYWTGYILVLVAPTLRVKHAEKPTIQSPAAEAQIATNQPTIQNEA